MRLLLILSALLISFQSTCALAGDPPLLATLHREFQPGLPLERAQALLHTHGATTSTKSAAECAKLVKESRVPTQITPRGGPCVFGKILGPRRWYGAHTDVILQLVFGPDGRLADANFEAIDTFF